MSPGKIRFSNLLQRSAHLTLSQIRIYRYALQPAIINMSLQKDPFEAEISCSINSPKTGLRQHGSWHVISAFTLTGLATVHYNTWEPYHLSPPHISASGCPSRVSDRHVVGHWSNGLHMYNIYCQRILTPPRAPRYQPESAIPISKCYQFEFSLFGFVLSC